MRTFAILSLAVFALLPGAVFRAQTAAAGSGDRLSAEISPEAVLATMKRVADWQLAHLQSSRDRYAVNEWTYGALYTGIIALSDIADLLDKSANTHTANEENQTQMFNKYGSALNS